MGLLRSYRFGSFLGVDEVPEKVLELFTDSVSKQKEVTYASEIIFSGIQGRIDLDHTFHLEAYEKAIKKNGALTQNNKRKKESYIEFGCSSEDYDSVAQNGGIQEDHLNIKDVQDAFEELIDDDELRYAVSNIKNLNAELIVVEEIDLIEALKLALKGIPQAISEIKRICDFYPSISESVQTILSSGKDFYEVFA